jgi:DNA-binding response OmpR family regulator
MRQLIFVVDSDANIRRLARESLEKAGYRVRTFFSLEMLERIDASPPALILLAVGRDDGSSLSFRWYLRQNIVLPKIPALFLVDNVAEEDQILALADDWIIKPFDPQELIARVQAVLRRSTTSTTAPQADSSELIIDSSGMKLFVRGVEVATTALEFRLIEYLARHHSQVFTRDLLLDAVWGQMQFVSPRCVDACVRRIREKIEPNRSRPTYLKTIRGVGYRLDTAVIWESPVNSSCGCVACTSAEQQFKN